MKVVKDIIVAFAGTIVRVAVLIIAIVLIIGAAKKAYEFGYRIFTEQPMSAEPGRDVTLNVTSGQGESDIATMLEEKGLIRDALLFRIQKKLSSYSGDIKPGTYTLNTCMNTEEMLEILVGTTDDGGEVSEDDEYKEELDPTTDDLTGLETGGVLSEEGSYDESEAFEEDSTSNEGEDEYIGEGDEESAIEE